MDKRYSERYNNDAFLLVVATAHKRDVAEYMSAIDMYHGNNAISIRRKFIRAKWEKNKMVEQPGSSLWVLSVDHDTRMEHVVEVDALSFDILNRHLLTDQSEELSGPHGGTYGPVHLVDLIRPQSPVSTSSRLLARDPCGSLPRAATVRPLT